MPTFLFTDFGWASIDYLVQHPFDTLLLVFAAAVVCYLLISLIVEEARQRRVRAEMQQALEELER